jgi:hypothetical protein
MKGTPRISVIKGLIVATCLATSLPAWAGSSISLSFGVPVVVHPSRPYSPQAYLWYQQTNPNHRWHGHPYPRQYVTGSAWGDAVLRHNMTHGAAPVVIQPSPVYMQPAPVIIQEAPQPQEQVLNCRPGVSKVCVGNVCVYCN